MRGIVLVGVVVVVVVVVVGIAIDLHTVSSNGSAKLFQVSLLAPSFESSPVFQHRQPKPGIASYSWGRAREKIKHAAFIVKRFTLHHVLESQYSLETQEQLIGFPDRGLLREAGMAWA